MQANHEVTTTEFPTYDGFRQTDASAAVKFNERVLRHLQKRLRSDPEADISSLLPLGYSRRLEARKKAAKVEEESCSALPIFELEQKNCEAGEEKKDIRTSLRSHHKSVEVFPISAKLKRELEPLYIELGDPEDGLSKVSKAVLLQSEVLDEGPSPIHKMVFRWKSHYAIKVIRDMKDFTEYTSLLYLDEHMPSVPAPRPHGLVKIGNLFLMFVTYLPSMTLEKVWKSLSQIQKISIQEQLDVILLKLRSIPYPAGMSLGGVGGEGCKDLRRNLRHNADPINSLDAFEDFRFSNPRFGGSVYINLLRQLVPTPSQNVVFTHGDLRPDNIVVQLSEEGHYIVTGLIDWEYSGFYPDYYEATKVTNCMSPNEENDWYLFIPPCISPKMFHDKWLVDRLWDRHVE